MFSPATHFSNCGTCSKALTRLGGLEDLGDTFGSGKGDFHQAISKTKGARLLSAKGLLSCNECIPGFTARP